ncbi:putative uncharacterized protein [Candidatus Colimorpha enterica]|uniref:Uncharacterized protein n=1 Tax=Candidatus Colimorpha enterica TaxID=3083063 RepID=R6TUT5_9BACT|nr:putative uncharacterized protein [Candidatus Colimorpha enterica]
MVKHIRVIILAELDPSGRAGGDHRESALVLYALNKLVRFLNDREVGGKVGVEHSVKAETAQSGDHLALNVCADRHSEALTEGSPDGGSGLNDNVLCRVAESLPYLVGVVLLGDGTGGTYSGTLTAGDAGNLAEVYLERGSDAGVDTSVIRPYDRDVLLAADSHTAAAENALVVVADEVRCACVKLVMRLVTLKTAFLNTVLAAELLKLAVRRTGAGEALLVVGREQKLKRGASCRLNLRGVGLDLHALGYGVNAGGNKSARTGSLNDADTAGADLVDLLHVAEGRDLNAGGTRSFKNRGALGYAYGDTVYFTINHFHIQRTPSYFLEIAPNLQPDMQAPHFTHLEASIT